MSEYTTLTIKKTVHRRLQEDRKRFEHDKGGRWSLSDTIEHYQVQEAKRDIGL